MKLEHIIGILLALIILMFYMLNKKESFVGSYSEGELRCISHGGYCPYDGTY